MNSNNEKELNKITQKFIERFEYLNEDFKERSKNLLKSFENNKSNRKFFEHKEKSNENDEHEEALKNLNSNNGDHKSSEKARKEILELLKRDDNESGDENSKSVKFTSLSNSFENNFHNDKLIAVDYVRKYDLKECKIVLHPLHLI